jgi:hypothetical protein
MEGSMKTSKWIKVMLSFMMIFALFAFAFPVNDGHAASSPKAKVVTKTYKEKKFLKYPQVSGLKSKTAQKKINTVLSKHIQGSYKDYLQLKKDMEAYKKDPICKEFPSACAYDYSTSYKVKYNRNGQLSIMMHDWMYAGGAHGLGFVTTYNFNLKTGNLYKLSDILTTKSKFTKVTTYAKKYIKNHPDIFFTDDFILRDFKVTNKNQFYFTNNGFYLIFQEYEVAPYAVGNPTIKVPRSVYK